MDLIKRETREQDGFTIIVDHVVDHDADLSYLLQDYDDVSEHERAQYKKQDTERMAAYHRGDWSMIGIAVTIRKQTATSNWADGGLEVGRASLWSIESDSDPEYFDEVARDLTVEAFAEVAKLKAALSA